jgi:hypothetical protein
MCGHVLLGARAGSGGSDVSNGLEERVGSTYVEDRLVLTRERGIGQVFGYR